MRAISNKDLDVIKKHLLKKPFKYEEVFTEVVDHYASAYEQSEYELDQVISELDNEFTSKKISEINQTYFNDLKKSLQKNHWSVFLGNFKWPQLIKTILYGLIFILIAPFIVDNNWLGIYLFKGFALVPTCFGLYYYLLWVFRRVLGRTSLKNAHAELFGLAIGFSVFYMQLPYVSKIFMGDHFKLLQYHPLLTACLLFLGMIQVSTSIKLITSRIKPALG